jgi:hypothetical protein
MPLGARQRVLNSICAIRGEYCEQSGGVDVCHAGCYDNVQKDVDVKTAICVGHPANAATNGNNQDVIGA